MSDDIAGVALFAAVPAIVWAVSHYRYKAKVNSGEVVKQMISSDKEVTPEIIKAVGFAPKRTHSDLRTGMIMIAIGIAFLMLGGVIPDEDGKAAFAAISMFPILIGIALLIFWYAISRKDQA